MKSKILKIVLGLILFSALFITVSSAATTVKEDVQDYDDIVYIIGSTRFDSDVIITAQRAANAGVSEAKRLVAMGKPDEIENLNLKTYCYIPDFKEWYEIQEEAKSLNKEEIKNIEENLNIFFVNNEEKTLEIEFDGVIDENSIVGPTNATPEIKNKKIIVPATWIEGFQFTSEGTKVEVKLSEDNNGKVEELDKPVIKKQPTMTASIPSSVYVGDDLEFTVSFKGNDFENENVKININTQYSGTSMEVNPIEKIEYYDEATKNWKEVDIYNQNNGLKMALKTGDVKFRAILNCEGNYKIQVNAMLEDSHIMLSSEQTNVNATMKENVVAKVGAKYYQDLTEAVNNANKSTVKLLKDITITDRLNIINKEVVLDLNKNTINIEGELSRITAGGTSKLTIQNGNVVSNGDYALQAQDDATLNVLDNVKVTTKSYGITVWDNAIVNYNGEIVITGDGYGISGNGGEASNTTININGGKITAAKGAAIYHPQTGVLNINDGKLTADTVVGIKAGTLNVLGGTLTATGEKNAPEKKGNGFNLTGDVVYIEENPAYRNNIHVNITGGTLTSTNGYIMQELNVTIGTEKERIPVVTGNYETRTMLENNVTIFTETSEATFKTANGGRYTLESLNNVINNEALNGGRITLLKDITLTDRLNIIDKEVVLDLNGNTINIEGQRSRITAGGTSVVTIENGNIISNGDYALQAQDAATLNVLDNVKVTTKSYGITVWDNAIVNYNGEIVITGDGYGISGNGGEASNTTININGGKITAAKGAAIYHPQTGTLNIHDGKLTANTVIGIKAGSLNVIGGTLTATGEKKAPEKCNNGFNYTGDVIYIEENPAYKNNIQVDVSGGTLTTTNGYIMQELNLTIGTENEREPVVIGNYATRTMLENNVTIFTETSEATFETANGGRYTLEELNNVINNQALNGDKIKLLKNITITERLNITDDVILDLGGNTINIEGANNRIAAKDDANVTIKNGNIVSNTNYGLQAQDNATLNVNEDLNIKVGGTENSSNDDQYGITVFGKATLNFKGDLTVEKTGKFACGISGNGSKPYENTNTTVNILGGNIKVEEGIAIYQPQRGQLNIKAGTLEANTTLGIKSGEISILGGTLIATGAKVEPNSMGNNIVLTGDAIYIEENTGYYGNVNINVTNGQLTSDNGYIIQEFNPTIGTATERNAIVTGNYATKNTVEGTTKCFYYTAE